jgi:hypothetical protein
MCSAPLEHAAESGNHVSEDSRLNVLVSPVVQPVEALEGSVKAAV